MNPLHSIGVENVRAAIAQVNRDGVPAGRGSTKFCLLDAGNHYPPKYLLALAAHDAFGRELRPDEYSGGSQTNSVLAQLGFVVQSCACGGTTRPTTPALRQKTSLGVFFPPATFPPRTDRTRASGVNDVSIVRIVCVGRSPAAPVALEEILYNAFTSGWPKGLVAKFVLTPGGFVRGAIPKSWSCASGWRSSEADLKSLTRTAEALLQNVISERVFDTALGKADVLTIGIDLHDSRSQLHAELVAVVDIRARRVIQWTGKSYPTSGQERTLVQVTDLSTHLLEIGGERVLVLGCHDLNMFNPRGHANQDELGQRRERCTKMRSLVTKFQPTVVLQHPHSSDTPKIWRMPWLALAREIPADAVWASGIAYYRSVGERRAKLENVLEHTKSDATQVRDIVVDCSGNG